MNLSDYKCVWKKVHEEWECKKKYCINELGLQALLYKELSAKFPKKYVVVEPLWYQGDKPKYRPDLVMISDDKISDVFEIKFAPWWKGVRYKDDVGKLLEYQGENWKYYSRLKDTYSGEDDPLEISKDCKFHLVRVAKEGSAATEPINISDKIILWYGRVSKNSEDDCWGISMGESTFRVEPPR